MREINKSRLNNEYIGIGRFRIDLIQEEWDKYEDGSGGCLFLIFQITDTFTKKTNVGFLLIIIIIQEECFTLLMIS